MIFIDKCKNGEFSEKDVKEWFDSILITCRSKLYMAMINCQEVGDKIILNISNTYDKIDKPDIKSFKNHCYFKNNNNNNNNIPIPIPIPIHIPIHIPIDANQIIILVRHTIMINELKIKHLENEWETIN